jgi:hypothetical protein
LNPAESSPELSVVVIVLGGGSHLVRCLEAFARQRGAPEMEIIVPRDARVSDKDEESLCALFPGVRFVPMGGEQTYAAMRTAGVKASRGKIVAITEDQCIPPESWCANVVTVHTAPHAAIGGPVDKFEPDTAINWSIYLRELGSYMTPVQEGPSEALTDCNVSYKRAALEDIADEWAEEFHEPGVHGALRQRGGTLWLSAGMLTYQQRQILFGPAIAERYAFGRLYGGQRVARVSAGRRLVLIALSPLLPLVMVVRVLQCVLRKGRYIGPCFAAMPYLVLFAVVWSWGELVGYVTGRVK